jgi:hypothetical protein
MGTCLGGHRLGVTVCAGNGAGRLTWTVDVLAIPATPSAITAQRAHGN